MLAKNLTEEQRNELINKLHDELSVFGLTFIENGNLNQQYIIQLDELKELHEKSLLDHDMIRMHEQKIATLMTEIFPFLKDQLSEYWNAWALIINKKTTENIYMREKVDQYLDDIIQTQKHYAEIIKNDPDNNLTALYAVFNIQWQKLKK
ncbi:MAG: hypothetical protein J4F36_09480 [Nitrosopumilaceae archaeon]|nr:hypothetical protein [Nitrosopumilaceae archaeon]